MTTARHMLCYFSFKTGQALGAGDSSILAKASETSRWLLQSNGSCNKPSPFLVYLDGWEEGSGERPLRREWVQGETVKASNIYWAIPCISRLHTLFYLILTTNFITTIIMPILYIGGEKPEVYRIVNTQPARVIHTIDGTGSLTQTRALDSSFLLIMKYSSRASPLSILPRKSTRTEVFFS